MNTQERILKLSIGGPTSRQYLSLSKAAYEATLAGMDSNDPTTAARQDEAVKYLESVYNQTSANPYAGKRGREREGRAYEIATQILNGTANTASFVDPSTKRGKSDANHTYVDFKMKNMAKEVARNNIQAAPTVQGRETHLFSFNAGMPTSTIQGQNETIGSKAKEYAKALRDNLFNAIEAKKRGAYVSGWKDNMVNHYNELAQKLDNSNFDWEKDGYNELAKIAQYYDNGDYWDSYFKGVLPKTSLADINKKKLENEEGFDFNIDTSTLDPSLLKLLKAYKIGKKGDSYYLINSDYSGVAKDVKKAFLNTDWRDPEKEGHGWAVGNDGSIFIGDLNEHAKDSESIYNGAITQYLKNLNNDARWHVNQNNFNKFTSLSDYDLINHFAEELHGDHGLKIVDLSRYFDGADVVATIKGNDFKSVLSNYGHLKLDDPNLHFYYKDKNSNFKSGTLENVKNDLEINDIFLNSDKALRGLDNFKPIDYHLDGLNWSNKTSRDNLDVNRRDDLYNWLTPNRALKNGWSGEITASDTSMIGHNSGIQNSPTKFAKLMLYAFDSLSELEKSKDINDKELLHTLGAWINDNESKLDLLYVIYELMSMHPEEFKDSEGRYRKAFLKLLMSVKGSYSSASREQEVVQLNREGGILKAAFGAGLDINGNPIPTDQKESIAGKMRDSINKSNKAWNALKESANNNGRDIHQQRAIERNEWTASDTLRATALATDVVGLIGAITGAATGGIGSAVAVGSGFVSMAEDAIADFTDEKVSAGQAWKNLGINAGLAAGAAFGAKAPKVIKGVMKMVPKAMMLIGTAGIVLDPEVLKTAGKIAEGKSLNINDWKNINIILRTAVGMGTMHATKRGSEKAVERFDKKVTTALEKEGINSNGEKVFKVGDKEVKASDIESINTYLKNNPTDEDGAAKMLAKMLGDESEEGVKKAAKFFETKEFRKWNKLSTWLGKKEKRVEFQFNETLKKLGLESLDPDVRAELYQQYLEENNTTLSGRLRGKNAFTKTMNWMDQAVEKSTFGLVKQQNYALNALEAGTNMSAKEIAKYIKDNKAIIGDQAMSEFDQSAFSTEIKNLYGKELDDMEALTKELDSIETEISKIDPQNQQEILDLRKKGLRLRGEIKDKIVRIEQFKNNMFDPAKLAAYEAARTQKEAADKQILDLWENNEVYRDPSGVKGQFGAQGKVRFKKELDDLELANKNFEALFKMNLADELWLGNADKLIERETKAITKIDTKIADLKTENDIIKKVSFKYNKTTGKETMVTSALSPEEKTIITNIIGKAKTKKKALLDRTAKNDTELLDLLTKKTRILNNKTALEGRRDVLSAERDRLGTEESSYKAFRTEQDALDTMQNDFNNLGSEFNDAFKKATANKTKLRGLNRDKTKLQQSEIAALRKQVLDLGKTSGKVTVTDTTGTTIDLPAKTKVSSMAHLRDKVRGASEEELLNLIKETIKSTHTSVKELTADAANKLIPKSMQGKVKGAFVDTRTNEVILFNNGGQLLNIVYNKYQHLRK